jgi:hypothetical protein
MDEPTWLEILEKQVATLVCEGRIDEARSARRDFAAG